MKKLLFLCFAVAVSTAIFASPKDSNSFKGAAKVRQVFHHNFPEIKNPSITQVGDFYLVYFANKEANSSCRIYYDADGNVVETISNYTSEQLAPFIRAKVESNYKGKTISMVTDVSNENEHYYEIFLRDATSLWIIHAKDNGTMFIKKKYKSPVK